MEQVKYKLELINEVLSYLGTRPFTEVAGLINKLQSTGELMKEEHVEETKQSKSK